MAKTLALVGGALFAMYAISHGCSYVKNRIDEQAIPFEHVALLEPDRMYKIVSNNVKMSLPGYELARRPPDMSLDDMLKRARKEEVVAKADE